MSKDFRSLAKRMNTRDRLPPAEDRCPHCQSCGVVQRDRMQTPCSCAVGEELLNEACEWLIQWVATLHPDWKNRLEIRGREHRLNARQIFGSYIAHMLENADQMQPPPVHPAFAPGFVQTREREYCAWPPCGAEFKPRFPGDRFCTTGHAMLDQKAREAQQREVANMETA